MKPKTLAELRDLEDNLAGRLCRLAARLDEVRRRRKRAEGRAAKLEFEAIYAPEVLAVACTTCNVGPGARCLRDGETVAPHAARVKASK